MRRKIIFAFICILSITAVFRVIRGHPRGEESISPRLATYPNLPYRELIFQPGEFPSSHAPSIIELPNGDLFAVWYAVTPWSNDAAIWGSRKPAGADKWAAPYIVNCIFGYSDKNPVLYLTEDKKLLLFWAEEMRFQKLVKDTIRMKTSDDFGHKWDKARNVGKLSWFLPRNRPIRLQNGDIVLPIYTDLSTSSAVAISKDKGLTWEGPRYMFFLFGIQPTIIERSDSSLFALMRTGMWPRKSWEAVSKDSGNSWKDQKLSDVKNPGCSLEMLKLNNGHVVLAFNDSKKKRSSLSLALSYDEGRSWVHSSVIEYIPGSTNIYPSIMQDKNGLIHVVYAYDGRASIAHFVTNEQWIAGN